MRRTFLITVCFLQVFTSGLYAEDQNPAEDNTSKVAAVFAELDKNDRYTDQLTYAGMNVLPMGFKQTISNKEFNIAISNARFHSNYAEVSVFARMKTAQGEAPLFFAGQDVKFSYTGDFIGEPLLLLVNDLSIRVNGHTELLLKGGGLDSAGRSSKVTSVTLDCKGFKELTLAGKISFSKDLLVKVDGNGKPLNEQVSVDFSTTAGGWNDILLNISLPPFQIKGLEGFTFNISRAVFDLSDFKNSPDIVFPEGYDQKYLIPDAPGLWRGVYAGEFSITLPKEFSEGQKPPVFAAKNLLIDENGVSGIFSAQNLLSIETGSASGWAFSIDKFWLGLEAHRITKAGFEGLIGLPVSDGTYLRYDAQILGNNNYQMLVATADTLDFSCFAAKARLYPNSYIKLRVENEKFLPEASLTGILSIGKGATSTDKKDPSSIIKLDTIQFRNLHLQTRSPYMTVEYLGYDGEIKLKGFPVSISDINVKSTDKDFSLGFNIGLNLDEKLVSAKTGIRIKSKYSENAGRGRWVYDGIEIGELELDNCNIAGILTLSGKLKIMDEDPVYGDGFYGNINMKFQKVIKDFNIGMSAAFGTKNNFRYWFVDGSVTVPKTIPIAGPVGIKGFSGGVSSRMKKVFGPGFGESETGIGYVPNEASGIGLKAGVIFAVEGDCMGGDASFEIMFNRHGGVDLIGFYGYLEFMPGDMGLGKLSSITDKYNELVSKEAEFLQKHPNIDDALTKLKQNPTEAAKDLTDAEEKAKNSSFGASAGIVYDIAQEILHANFDVYINTPMMQGAGAGNKAGSAVLHIEPGNWYIHVGTPDNRVGVKIGVPKVATITTGAYFMMGDNLPGSPPPPDDVTRILGRNGDSYHYMQDLNSLVSGKGLAFGSSVQVKTGDLQFLILYASFNAGIGFDVMIKDYREAQCKGHSGPIGINGWYANGQAYAYLEGELGVKVNLWFVSGRFPIIQGAAAALIQAKLPNPTWFAGSMGVKFNLLCGLVKGSMRFKFIIGEECELVMPGSSPIDLMMISDLSPGNNDSEVDVFTAPQLALSMPVNTGFEVDTKEGERKTYRVSLGKFEVKDGSKTIEGEISWNRDGTVATFRPHETLPERKQLGLHAAVTFEELVNGQWVTSKTSGTQAQETRDFSFTTGAAPDHIPLGNIVYSYPMVGQPYYYPKESSSGFVQLRTGQSYLFPGNWKYKLIFVDETGKTAGEVLFMYDSRNNRIGFTTPNLSREKSYQIGFITEPVEVAAQNEENPMKETVLLSDEENLVTQYSATASKVLNYSGGGKVLLNYDFRTSKYQTFASKVQSMRIKNNRAVYCNQYIFGVTQGISLGEGFDEAEVYGIPAGGNQPLVQMSAILDDRHYNEKIYPITYAEYPVGGSYRLRREGDEIGIPPVNAFVRAMYGDDIFPFVYALPEYYYYDFDEMRTVAANHGIRHPSLEAPYFPDIISGQYKALFQYYLPGGEKGSSEVVFEYTVNK
jgi:hypothetical protein